MWYFSLDKNVLVTCSIWITSVLLPTYRETHKNVNWISNQTHNACVLKNQRVTVLSVVLMPTISIFPWEYSISFHTCWSLRVFPLMTRKKLSQMSFFFILQQDKSSLNFNSVLLLNWNSFKLCIILIHVEHV